jgi:5-methylcytosine-specific restriction endonuclease McrA
MEVNMKKSWKKLDGSFYDRQRADSDIKCACGCGRFISNRAAKAKAKGLTEGYVKGHGWRNKKMPESARLKMSLNHADVSGSKNPNYGKGLFGKDNPNWQGGKKEKYYTGKNQPQAQTKQDRAFRSFIKARDKTCVLCGRKNMLQCHHINSWVKYKKLRYDPNNAVTLCIRCHPRADNKHHKQRIKPMLEAYINSL